MSRFFLLETKMTSASSNILLGTSERLALHIRSQQKHVPPKPGLSKPDLMERKNYKALR